MDTSKADYAHTHTAKDPPKKTKEKCESFALSKKKQALHMRHITYLQYALFLLPCFYVCGCMRKDTKHKLFELKICILHRIPCILSSVVATTSRILSLRCSSLTYPIVVLSCECFFFPFYFLLPTLLCYCNTFTYVFICIYVFMWVSVAHQWKLSWEKWRKSPTFPHPSYVCMYITQGKA